MWKFILGFFAGAIFGFSGVVSFVELIEKETDQVVHRIGPEIQKCEKPLWERITDGCDESTDNGSGNDSRPEEMGADVSQ
jgi:hypothetical protein